MLMMMGNEKNIESHPLDEDYRFIDYRLDQLEHNLQKGQERLEQESKRNYEEILKTLRAMQQSQTEQNKQLIIHEGKLTRIEEKIQKIDHLNDASTESKQEIINIHHRLGVIRKIMFLIGGATVTALITAFFNLLTK